MKRKADENWTTDSAWTPCQGCCQPSLFCDSGDRFSTASISSSAISDHTVSHSSSPYMFMNHSAGATTSNSLERSVPSMGKHSVDASSGILGVDDHVLESMAKIDGEKLLASEMQALSVNEREEIYEEIHIGVRKNAEETPEFIQTKLRLFEQQLIVRHQLKPKREKRGRQKQQQSAASKEPHEHPSAYQQALFLAPRYVKNPNFRLLFLRSESFDVAKAATKFAKHFELKRHLFGVDKLGKAIDFFDLEEDDIEALRNGAFHMVPNVRDRSGRRVFLDNLYCYKSTNGAQYNTQSRLIWYSFMREMEKYAESQHQGNIAVWYAMGLPSKSFAQLIVAQQKHAVIPFLPLLGVCAHVCMDNPQLRPIISMFLAATPKQHRLRTRLHFGSDMECQYALSTFGLANDLLPYDSDGYAKRDRMEKIITKFQAEEDKHCTNRIREETGDSIALYASNLDVLVGKGMRYQNSKGMLCLQQLVEQSMPRYIAAKDDRFTKTTLFLDVMQVIKRDGGRFLKRHPDSGNICDSVLYSQKAAASSEGNGNKQKHGDSDVWLVVEDDVAREKVASSFRTMSRRPRNQH